MMQPLRNKSKMAYILAFTCAVLCSAVVLALSILLDMPEYQLLPIIILSCVGVFFGIGIFVFYKIHAKYHHQFIDFLNQNIDLDYQYIENQDYSNQFFSSLFPCNKRDIIHAKDGLIGKMEDISFEYARIIITKDEFEFSKDKTFDLYIFRNISLYKQEYAISQTKIKKGIPDYEETPFQEAFLYSKGKIDCPTIPFPKQIVFLSRVGQNLYVFKNTTRKKNLSYKVNSKEEFISNCKVQYEEIKQTFELVKDWIIN